MTSSSGPETDDTRAGDDVVDAADSPLRREIRLPMLVLYGLGTTVGAGIYALTGEVAGQAGTLAPFAFGVAAVLATATALSYAELAGRLPRAAGDAVFVDHAFGRRHLTIAVGLAVLVAGTVAAAAIVNAFGGYLAEQVAIPSWVLILVLVVVLSGVAVSGARESVGVAAAFTVVELGGLALVLWAGRDVLGGVPGAVDDLLVPGLDVAAWGGVMGGAFLAFFAFLGFEDLDSVAEEATDPTVTLPRAILWTMGLTTVLYLAVAAVAVLTVDPVELGASDAPMALVYERSGGSASLLTTVAALAMVNGALVHLVMLPRVVYGMSRLGMLPAWAGVVSPRTDTPVRATVAGAAVVGALAVGVDLAPLARSASAVTMAVFLAVNLALVRIKTRDGHHHGFEVPRWVPVLGVAVSAAMFVAEAVRLSG